LETEKRSLQGKAADRSADAMSELQMQIQELAVGDSEVGGGRQHKEMHPSSTKSLVHPCSRRSPEL